MPITSQLGGAPGADSVSSSTITDGSIVNADVNASAAIALSKLATTTASRALVSDSSGFVSSATTTATEIGYVNGVTSPIQTQLDALTAGLNLQTSVVAASTVDLTVTYANGTSGVGATLTNAGAQAAFSLDGQSPTVNQRVLIKNQASSLQNGIYKVTTVGDGSTNWVLTRVTDYDSIAEITAGDLVPVTAGTVNSGTFWLQTATVSAVGTDAISFSNFYTPATFAKVANNLSDLANVATAVDNLGGASSTGSGGLVRATSPTLVTPTLGVASATSINFGGNALSAYATSTYTPSITGASTNPVFSSVYGEYTRIGNRCFVDCVFTGDGGNEGSGAGQLSVSLPINSAATGVQRNILCGVALNNATFTYLTGKINSASSTIALCKQDGTNSDFTGNDMNNTSRTLRLQFNYQV